MTLLPGGDPRYDIGRTGLPAWAKRDTGPLNTYVPGPMSNAPLENSYNTSMRLWISGLIFAGVIVFVVVNAKVGVVGTVLGLIGLWALYAVPTWLRGRTGLRVDGPQCAVHGWFREVSFAGEDVAKVQHVFAGRSPDVRLVLRDGRKVMVVASRIEKGHSTLFEWLRRYAPDAEYDAKSIDIRDMLVTRGLMGAPGDAWDLYGPGRVTPGPTTGVVDEHAAPVPTEHRDEAAPTRFSEEHRDEAAPTRLPEEHRDEAAPTRLPEEHRDEAAPPQIPEEQPGEAPLRLEGSPTEAPSPRIPEEPLCEATPPRIPEESLREATPPQIPEEQPGEATPPQIPEEQPGEAPLRLEGSPTEAPTPRIPEGPAGEAAPPRIPEEQPGEAPLRLEGSPTDPTDPAPEAQAEDTIRMSPELMREARQRIEGSLAGTVPADVPSDVEPPAATQGRPESEDS